MEFKRSKLWNYEFYNPNLKLKIADLDILHFRVLNLEILTFGVT